MKYAMVKPEELERVWLEVKVLIEKAKVYAVGESNSEHIRRWVHKGEMALFIGWDETGICFAMVSKFVYYANYTALRVLVFAGNTAGIFDKAMEEYWPSIVFWAKSQGAERCEAYCHPSMTRLLKKYGFEPQCSVVGLNLDN